MATGDIVGVTGLVRGTSASNYTGGGGEGRFAANSRGDQSVVLGLLPKTELVRLGDSWSCMIPTGSAYTNVANMPTTRSELSLYNGEPGTGKHYVIDTVSFLSLTSVTAAAGVTLIYQVNSVTALTDNTAILINSPMGKSYGGRALRALATTTAVANKWTALAATPAGAAASIGLGVVAEVNGGIIVPPGYTLHLNAVIGTATGTSLLGVSWHEVQLTVA